jgi:DNA-directed RNA polymerase specialized sigma24 family protein
VSASFVSPDEVVFSLLTYTDRWQPSTESILPVGKRRGGKRSDGLRVSVLGSQEERTELAGRMALLPERDRELLFLWYIRQLEARDIARILGISRRQCFRRRANAIRMLVDMDGSTG